MSVFNLHPYLIFVFPACRNHSIYPSELTGVSPQDSPCHSQHHHPSSQHRPVQTAPAGPGSPSFHACEPVLARSIVPGHRQSAGSLSRGDAGRDAVCVRPSHAGPDGGAAGPAHGPAALLTHGHVRAVFLRFLLVLTQHGPVRPGPGQHGVAGPHHAAGSWWDADTTGDPNGLPGYT